MSYLEIFSKQLITETKLFLLYIVRPLSFYSYFRCEEFEVELSSIREDMIDMMDGDGWVVKLIDSPLVEEYAVGKTDQPVIIMFRNGLPVIYDGRLRL